MDPPGGGGRAASPPRLSGASAADPGASICRWAVSPTAPGPCGPRLQPWDRSHWEEPALTVVDDDIDVSQAEVVDGVLAARIQRRSDVPVKGGTVTLGRVLGRGGSRLKIDGVPAGTVRGGKLVDAHESLASTDAGLVITLRDNDAHLVVLTPQPWPGCPRSWTRSNDIGAPGNLALRDVTL